MAMIHVAQTACYSWTSSWESSFTDTYYILRVIYCIFFNKANNKHRQPSIASQDNMYFEYFRPLLWSTLALAFLETHERESSFCNRLQADDRGNTATWSCKLIQQIYSELLRLVHTLKHKSPPCFWKQKTHLSHAHRFISSLSVFSDFKRRTIGGEENCWALSFPTYFLVHTSISFLLSYPLARRKSWKDLKEPKTLWYRNKKAFWSDNRSKLGCNLRYMVIICCVFSSLSEDKS